MNYISQRSGLVKDSDIKILTNNTMDSLNQYLDANPDSVDYVVILCYSQ